MTPKFHSAVKKDIPKFYDASEEHEVKFAVEHTTWGNDSAATPSAGTNARILSAVCPRKNRAPIPSNRWVNRFSRRSDPDTGSDR